MKTLLLILLLIPLFTYSQRNQVFDKIKVNTIRISDTFFIEDNVGETLFAINNNDTIYIDHVVKLNKLLIADTLKFYDSEVGFITLSELARNNNEIEIGDNLKVAIIISIMLLSIAMIMRARL